MATAAAAAAAEEELVAVEVEEEGELKIRRGLLCYRPTPTMLSQLLAGLNQRRSLLGI